MNKKTFKYLEKLPTPRSNPGNKVRIEHTLKYEGNVMYLEEVRRVDIQKEISSHLEGCSLARMLTRYAMGDPEALERDKSGLYGDFSAVGGDYDLQVMQENGKAAAAHVDAAIKRRKNALIAKGKAAEAASQEPAKNSEKEVNANVAAADTQ